MTIQQAWFDGLGRRVKKVVTKSGDLDGTTVYHYNGHQMIESRDGSANVVTQVYHGTRYIDEVVSMRTEYGRVYLHQDANYNVTSLTDITGRVLERYYYSPYGALEVVVDAHPFDYDDDGDVDSDDADAADTEGTCRGDYSGDCRRLDADCDRDVDGDDYTIINNFVTSLSGDMELQRVPAATRSQLGNVFAHQGLQLDAEIGSYQNRARQYAPTPKRFMQRDPLTLTAIKGCSKSNPFDRGCAGSGYFDGMNLYAFLKSSPIGRVDPSGLSVRCGTVTCDCGTTPDPAAGSGGGLSTVPVYGDSERAKRIIPGGIGCVTLLVPRGIYCTGSCADIKAWEVGPEGNRVPILDHECCHECDYKSWGFCRYLRGWWFDDCTERAKPSTPSW